MNNENPWFNMKLVGIMWGNDHNYFTSSYENRKKLSRVLNQYKLFKIFR